MLCERKEPKETSETIGSVAAVIDNEHAKSSAQRCHGTEPIRDGILGDGRNAYRLLEALSSNGKVGTMLRAAFLAVV